MDTNGHQFPEAGRLKVEGTAGRPAVETTTPSALSALSFVSIGVHSWFD
jgi:hypothetical protein